MLSFHKSTRLLAATSLAAASVFASTAQAQALDVSLTLEQLQAVPSSYAPRLPEAFSTLTPALQYRVCGDVLASLAINGVRDMASRGKTLEPENIDDEYVSLFDVAANGILITEAVELAAPLSAAQKDQAREAYQVLEAGDDAEFVTTAIYCQRQVYAWLDAGVISPSSYETALIQATTTIPMIADPETMKRIREQYSTDPDSATESVDVESEVSVQ